MLDYWAASLWDAAVVSSADHVDGSQEAVLDAFDEQSTLAAAAAAAERAFGPSAGDRRELDVLRRLMLRLLPLAPEDDRPVVTKVRRTDLRRAAGRDRIVDYGRRAPSRSEVADRVLDKLYAAGVTRITRTADGDEWVALAHGALPRYWRRLGDWIEWRTQFRERARQWARGRGTGALVRDSWLEEGRAYADLNDAEIEFIEASVAEQARRNLQMRLGLVALGAVAIAAVVAIALLIVRDRREADIRRENDRREAEARQADRSLDGLLRLTRSFAEAATAPNVAEQRIAMFRWGIVRQEFADDARFGPAVRRADETLTAAAAPGATDADAWARAQVNLPAVRALRADVLRPASVRDRVRGDRERAYRMVKLCAGQTAATIADEPLVNAAPYVREFWNLYWGPMLVLEGGRVEGAMVRFGDALKAADDAVRKAQQTLTPLNDFQLQSINAQLDLMSDRERPTRQIYQGYALQQLAKLDPIATTQPWDAGVDRAIRGAAGARVAPEQRQALLDALAALDAALDAELKAAVGEGPP